RDEIVITIHDSGIGIEKKNLEIIFEKFVRAQDPSLHSTGKTKFMGAGPGLGLTIARGVIDGHGGSIYAESPAYDPEGMPGSTFYIILPVKPPEDATGAVHFEMTQMDTGIRDRLLQALEESRKQDQPSPST
ncbi:MAG TPA: HAMP domain-containing sensor histidine kinase, partial [Aggregatilineales bacterium]|nr:HAMP domain-containing sensor histidine kinase [Aggregatilineales bacterium]